MFPQVTHDCRMMSDMLYHQYNIVMVNVFDTQVNVIPESKQQQPLSWSTCIVVAFDSCLSLFLYFCNLFTVIAIL